MGLDLLPRAGDAMIECDIKPPTVPIPFARWREVVAVVGEQDSRSRVYAKQVVPSIVAYGDPNKLTLLTGIDRRRPASTADLAYPEWWSLTIYVSSAWFPKSAT